VLSHASESTFPRVLDRNDPPPRAIDHVRGALKRGAAEVVQWGWEAVVELGSIGPRSRRGRRFGRLGEGSVICFPAVAIFNEQYIHIGNGTLIGPHVSLSAGMVPGQVPVSDPVISIGDRCLIGKGSGIVGHLSIEIGDDVWTGHYVYVTDQNHGYEDVTLPISKQSQAERPVTIGSGSWLGHGTVVLPGSQIGRHVAVAAGSVVSGTLPDNCVAAGAPAKPIREWDGQGWPRSEELPSQPTSSGT
jgi:acetyltransferase-like isoleucine patch superfamily enzyme